MYNHPDSESGFTLLEVMVAMAVLAIAGMALMGTAREGITNTQYLNNKRAAYWVAENVMTDIQLARKLPPDSWREQIVTMVNREWIVRSRSIKTVTKGFHSLEVEVREDKTSEIPLAQLQSHKYYL